MSRWEAAWRIALASSTAGMAGVLALTLWGENDVGRPDAVAALLFPLVVPIVLGALGASSARWLTRFHALTQTLLFGALGIAVGLVPWTVFALVNWSTSPILVAFGFLLLLSAGLLAAIGHLSARASTSPRGTTVLCGLFAALLLAFVFHLTVSA